MSTSSAVLVYKTAPFVAIAVVQAALESVPLPQATLTFMGLLVSSDTTSGAVRTIDLALVPTAPATATAQLQPGGGAPSASPVFSLTLTNPGSGYAAPPVVSIVPAAGDTTGKGAKARATLNLVSVTLVVGGSGYVTPVVTVVGGLANGGVPATVTATMALGVITGFVVTSPGGPYQGVPQIVITDAGGGAGASGTAVLQVGSLVLTNPGEAYSAPPAVVLTPLFKSQWPDGPSQAEPLNNLFTIGLQKGSLLQIVASPPVIT